MLRGWGRGARRFRGFVSVSTSMVGSFGKFCSVDGWFEVAGVEVGVSVGSAVGRGEDEIVVSVAADVGGEFVVEGSGEGD